jgi:hypothetical protein
MTIHYTQQLQKLWPGANPATPRALQIHTSTNIRTVNNISGSCHTQCLETLLKYLSLSQNVLKAPNILYHFMSLYFSGPHIKVYKASQCHVGCINL